MAAHVPAHEDLPLLQQMLRPMQLCALGMHNWLMRGTVCSWPIIPGSLIIWLFLLVRGIVTACDVFNIVDIVLVRFDSVNPFMHAVRTMMLASSIGDITASVCGFWCSFDRRVVLSLITVVWTFIHLFAGMIFSVLVAWLDTMQVGIEKTIFLLVVFLIGVDFYVLIVSLQNFMAVTLRRTVAPSTLQILGIADSIAAESESHVTNRNHIIAALLQDDISLQRLRLAGVDIDAMNAELRGGTYLRGDEPDLHKRLSAERMHFGSDAAQLMSEAAAEQWQAEDDRLTADHILLALCCREGPSRLKDLSVAKLQNIARRRRINYAGSDQKELVATLRAAGVEDRIPQVALTPSRGVNNGGSNIFLAPEANLMRAGIDEQRHLTKVSHGPPPALVFGCVPLEEMVAVYIVLQVLACITSVCCLLFQGRGLGVVLGLRTVSEMRTIEGVQSIGGMVVGLASLWGINRHRWARREVREAAYIRTQRWDLELDEAFNKVKEEKDVYQWYEWLKLATTLLSLNLIWNFIQLLVQVPSFAMFLIYGNVCNSYDHAMNHVHEGFADYGEAPMHCSDHDLLIIAYMVLLAAFEMYMAWCMLCLWHQYAFGWTTTEFRGSAYLDPFGPVPESLMRQLMGLPRAAQRRLSGPEGQPIIL